MAKRPTAWVVCYIDKSQINNLKRDLSKKPKYRLIRAYVPTVRLLSKQFKGKSYFEEVPLLFNYGFFEVPIYFLWEPSFLDQFKKDIRCIYGFVRDPAKEIRKKPKFFDLKKQLVKLHGPALATSDEIANIIRAQKHDSIYSSKDIQDIRPGMVITLKGYPFEGLDAEVISVDEGRKELTVRLLLAIHMSTVKVSYENVFYTIYNSQYMVNEMKEKSLDEMREHYKNIDGLFTKVDIVDE